MVDTAKVKEIVKEKQQEQQGKSKGQSEIQNLLNTMKDEFRKVLPETIKPDRLIRIALTEMRMNPRLFDASKESLLGALMLSAQLGLEPGPLGYCYLVPYNNKRTGQLEIQFQLGYKGILELVRRSGQVESIEARVVYEKDRFDFSFGLEPKLVHKPALRDHGKPICVYAIARFKSGGYVFDVMSVEEIEQIRKRSKSADNGPWQTDWEAMAKKTIIKRLCKYLPLS
ncbi:MAG TPA: recombinase RecT, partial [Paludibacteraceae bacterium]|nr:recombinase RecT [Paludibacteraceae bacterium]